MGNYNVDFSRNGVKMTPLEALMLIIDRTVSRNNNFIHLKVSKTYMSRGNIQVITCFDEHHLTLPVFMVEGLTKEQFCDILFKTYPELKSLKEEGYQLDGYRLEQHFRPSYIHRMDITDAEKKEFSLYYNLIYANFYKYME